MNLVVPETDQRGGSLRQLSWIQGLYINVLLIKAEVNIKFGTVRCWLEWAGMHKNDREYEKGFFRTLRTNFTQYIRKYQKEIKCKLLNRF